jgi:hypothetical protein
MRCAGAHRLCIRVNIGQLSTTNVRYYTSSEHMCHELYAKYFIVVQITSSFCAANSLAFIRPKSLSLIDSRGRSEGSSSSKAKAGAVTTSSALRLCVILTSTPSLMPSMCVRTVVNSVCSCTCVQMCNGT